MIVEMFELICEKGRFYRVKHGQNARQVSQALCQPLCGDVFCGMIIPVDQTRYKIHTAAEGESFLSLSRKYGVDEEKIKSINGGVIYPSKKLFVPVSR